MFSNSTPRTAWRTTLQNLRHDFQQASESYPEVRHAIVQAHDEAHPLPPSLEREMREAGGWNESEMRARWELPPPGTEILGPEGESPSYEKWLRFNCHPERSYLFGDPAGRKKFERLAERAWHALPGTRDGKLQAYPQPGVVDRWLTCVYGQLRRGSSSYLSDDEELWILDKCEQDHVLERKFPPCAVQEGGIVSTGYPGAEQLPEEAPRWVCSMLGVDVFTASAVAIDYLLANPDPAGYFLISWEEMHQLQNSPGLPNDNFLVDMILLGERARFPIYRDWCLPVDGDSPSLCPNADPPTDERDRRALQLYLPKIEKRFRELRLIGKGQTIHWVGRQVTLGTVCRCSSGQSLHILKREDGTIEDKKIWIDGQLCTLTTQLRECLSFILRNPDLSLERLRNQMGWTDSAHGYKRINDLNNKLAGDLAEAPRRMHVWVQDSIIKWEWVLQPNNRR